MPFGKCKIYSDGSHYIAIPHIPRKKRPRKPIKEEKIVVKESVDLGDYELNELTPINIQKFVTYLSQSGNLKTGAGLSPNSVNAIITVIQGSLETANRIGLSNEYTADKVNISCFFYRS